MPRALEGVGGWIGFTAVAVLSKGPVSHLPSARIAQHGLPKFLMSNQPQRASDNSERRTSQMTQNLTIPLTLTF